MRTPPSIRLLPVFLFALATTTPPAHAQEAGFGELPASSSEMPAPVSAQELLQDCRDRMPADPVSLSGWIRYRRARGIVDKEFNFQARLLWGAAVPTLQYTLADTEGTTLAQATFRHAGTPSEFVYLTGPSLEPAAPPAWNDSVLGTDITWLDFSMDFLHWTEANLNGEATVRGRLCDLVEVYPPTPIPGCKKVRLWVDREIRMFLQAQQVDENGKIQRQMWVRSVKKMNDRWMIQDLEVESRNSAHRTRIHVLECK